MNKMHEIESMKQSIQKSINAEEHLIYTRQNFIIWIDQNLNLPLENRDHDQQLRKIYGKMYQGFDNIYKALSFIKELENYELIIICSGQMAYQFLKMTQDYNIIIYCGDIKKHSKLFLENRRVKVMIDSKFADVITEIQEIFQYYESLQKLDQIFNPKVLQCGKYQHSEKYISTSIFFLMEQYDKNVKISIEQVISDIANLLPKGKHFQAYQLQNNLLYLKEKLQREITVLESFLYLYSRPEIYEIINKSFSSCRFEEVKYIFLCLLQGFQSSKTQIQGKLYRGISFQLPDYENVLQSLQESQKKGTSLFWNALSSTSFDKQIAVNFACSTGKIGSIVFSINLDKKDPHPHLLIDESISYYKNEKEVLLFPLFEFQVCKISTEKCQKNKIQYIKVHIQQKKDSFSQVFDNHKKHSFWMNNIREQIKPYFNSILRFHSKRYQFMKKNENFLKEHDQFKEILEEQQVYSQQQTKKIIEQVIPFMDSEKLLYLDYQFNEIQQAQLSAIFQEQLGIVYTEIQNQYNLRGSEIKIDNICQALNQFYEILEKNINLNQFESSSPFMENLKWLFWVISSVIFPKVKIYFYIFLFIAPKLLKAAKAISKIFRYQNATKKEKIEKIANLLLNLLMLIIQDLAKNLQEIYPELSLPIQIIFRNIDIKCLCINLEVKMKSQNLRKVKNDVLVHPGFNPKCVWSQVNEKVNSFIIIASDKKTIFWLVPNIHKNTREIHENCGLGIKLQNHLDYIYIGPQNQWNVSFQILGIAEEHIEVEEVLQKLENSQIQIIQQSSIALVF